MYVWEGQNKLKLLLILESEKTGDDAISPFVKPALSFAIAVNLTPSYQLTY